VGKEKIVKIDIGVLTGRFTDDEGREEQKIEGTPNGVGADLDDMLDGRVDDGAVCGEDGAAVAEKQGETG